MSEQADQANAFARSVLGAEADKGIKAPDRVHSPIVDKEVPFVHLPTEGYALSCTAKDVGAILKTNGVFRREQLIVTVDEQGRLEEMTGTRFCSYVEKHMVVGKIKTTDDGPKKKIQSMTRAVAEAVLASDFFRNQQRSLRRVNRVQMPVIRPDGKLDLLSSGYDTQSGIYTQESPVKIRSMTKEEAVALLRELHAEFPFGDRKEDKTSRSLAVSVAAMLSVFGVDLLGPMTSRLHFVYTANAPRSGKSLLAKMAIVPTCGPANVRVKSDSSEELRKELASAVINGASYFFIDDLDGMLKSQELNAFMTSATLGGRVLGGLEEYSVLKQCTVFITGNNLALSTDIANRTLRCNLYTEDFDAQARKITRTIDEEWLCRDDSRGDILSALWALIKAWDESGRPRGPRMLRGFERWCEVFGGIVHNAGLGDPCEAPPDDDYSGDTEVADMRTLIEALADDMGLEKKKEFTFQEIVECCQEHECFSWMMEGVMKTDKDSKEEWLELNQRSKSALGKMLAAKYGGRKFRLKDNRCLQFGQRGKNRHRKYTVEIV